MFVIKLTKLNNICLLTLYNVVYICIFCNTHTPLKTETNLTFALINICNILYIITI